MRLLVRVLAIFKALSNQKSSLLEEGKTGKRGREERTFCLSFLNITHRADVSFADFRTTCRVILIRILFYEGVLAF